MTTIDGITPPTKHRKKRPQKRKPQAKTFGIKNNLPKEEINQNKIESRYRPAKNDTHKHRLVWIVSIAIVVIIFISWGSSLLSNNLVSNNTNNNGSFLENFTKDLNEIWDKFQKDYLNIKEQADDAPKTEEERIKKLEEKVFPNLE